MGSRDWNERKYSNALPPHLYPLPTLLQFSSAFEFVDRLFDAGGVFFGGINTPVESWDDAKTEAFVELSLDLGFCVNQGFDGLFGTADRKHGNGAFGIFRISSDLGTHERDHEADRKFCATDDAFRQGLVEVADVFFVFEIHIEHYRTRCKGNWLGSILYPTQNPAFLANLCASYVSQALGNAGV